MKNTLLITIIIVAVVIILVILGIVLTQYPYKTTPLIKDTSPTITTPNPVANNPTPTTTPSTTETAKTYNIAISGFAFSPATLNIKKGDKVTWTNQDSVSHTVTSDSGNELDSDLLSKSKTYEHTFNTVGTYNYHCTPHPNMKAKIIVE